MYYEQEEERVAVLVDVNTDKQLLLFNTVTKRFEYENDSLEILDLIKCEESTEQALINPAIVESEAKNAVRTWCQLKGIDVENVKKICAVYLTPKPKKRSIRTIFKGVINYKKEIGME